MATARMLVAAILFCEMKRLVSAAEGWAVVGVGGRRGWVVGVGGASAGAAQRGLGAVLLVVELALVLDASEAGLDVVELRGGDDVVGPRGHDGSDLFLRAGDTVGCLRVIGEDLGEGTGLVFLERVDLFKELDEGLRVVAA